MIEEEIFWIAQGVGSLVFGIICAVMAPKRGRSAVGWFFIGFIFGCFALIVLMLVPDLKAEAAKEQHYQEENRMLRELLKKERQVSDSRHRVHGDRLTAHDRALGVDTAPAELSVGAPAAQPGLPPPLGNERQWYYAVGGQQQGPVTGRQLRDLWLDQQVPDSALVWTDGMPDWRPIGEVGDVLGEQS